MASDNFSFPDKEGFFGEYGGKFVPETLMYALEQTFHHIRQKILLYQEN